MHCFSQVGAHNADSSGVIAAGVGMMSARNFASGFCRVITRAFRAPVCGVARPTLRAFFDNRMTIAGNFLIASGYTGQSVETIPFQPDPCPVECSVGVPLKSYVSLSWTYFLRN